MADTFYGEMREPLSNEEAPPQHRCAKCNSIELRRTYHRDLIACILMHQRNGRQSRELCGGEHLHWHCRDCGYDFTSACASGHDD